ncbi:MAG: caleosin family protein [Vicinamibacteria bacterium]|nr:caleosin family protein [Vicinamibacteria bacterium]
MTAAVRARQHRPRPGRAARVRLRTALQKHVDFFDQDGDGLITLAETYSGLRRLGLDPLRSAAAAAVINGALGPATSGAPRLSIDTRRIHAGMHASDTGVYDSRGRFSITRFERLFARYDVAGQGALDDAALRRLFTDQRTDWLGHLASRAEFGLLLELAGQLRDGRKVLTRERLLSFYDGSLFGVVADELAAGRDRAQMRRRAAARSRARRLA